MMSSTISWDSMNASEKDALMRAGKAQSIFACHLDDIMYWGVNDFSSRVCIRLEGWGLLELDGFSDTSRTQYVITELGREILERAAQPAQTERDAEAGDAPSVNVIAAYVGELEATVASLQAELEATRKQVAAAVEMATAARKEIAELFDPEQRFDRSKDGRFVTETLNFADASLMLIEGIVKGEATPQPAPAGDLLAAAVKRVIALAPHNRPEMGDLTTMNNNATQITTIARFESEQAYWRVATILKTALKECGYADDEPL